MSGAYVTPPIVPCPPPLLDAIPKGLTIWPRWMPWRLEKSEKGKKPNKAPYRAPGGFRAKKNEPDHWASFAVARKTYEDGGTWKDSAKDFSGVGIALGDLVTAPLWLCGIDIDSCLDEHGDPLPWAVGVLAWIAQTYAEKSSSGTGVKGFLAVRSDDIPKVREMFGIAVENFGRKFTFGSGTDHPPAVEVYLGAAYFAVTGDHWGGSAAGPVEVDLAMLGSLRAMLPDPKVSNRAGAPKDNSRSAKAFRMGLRLLRTAQVADGDIEGLRAALLAASDPDIVTWTEEKGSDHELGNIMKNALGIIGGAPESWIGRLSFDEKLQPRSNVRNAVIALTHAADLDGLVAFDDMLKADMLTRAVPESEHPAEHFPRGVVDTDHTDIQVWMQGHGIPTMARDHVIQAVESVARAHTFHPVRNYLNGAKRGDGPPELDAWLIKYAGVKDSHYTRKISRMTLIAMVARVFEPGCKVDYVLVLQGEQGMEKSKLLSVLAGEWFGNHMPRIDGQNDIRASMYMRGKWIIEVAEMHAYSKADVEHFKGFITRQSEQYVPLHKRAEVDERRQGVFIGTTNKAAFLRDETGNRRFLPAEVGKIDIEGLKAARDQLFAEAVAAYRAGEHWWPDRDFEEMYFKPEQDARFDEDAWEDTILPFLDGKTNVCIGEIWTMPLDGKEAARCGRREQLRITAILERAGWSRRHARGEGGTRVWVPPGTSNPLNTYKKKKNLN